MTKKTIFSPREDISCMDTRGMDYVGKIKKVLDMNNENALDKFKWELADPTLMQDKG